MSTMTVNDVTERYVAFWNADEPEAQRRLASRTFAEGVEYHAPIGEFAGQEALIDLHARLSAQVAGAAFVPRQVPDSHRDRVRLKWEIVLPGEVSFATGTDILVLGDDGRIASVTTFIDRPPAGFGAEQADPHP